MRREREAARAEASRLLWRYAPPEARIEVTHTTLDNGQGRPGYDDARARAGEELLERAESELKEQAELLVAWCAVGNNTDASSLARALVVQLTTPGLFD